MCGVFWVSRDIAERLEDSAVEWIEFGEICPDDPIASIAELIGEPETFFAVRRSDHQRWTIRGGRYRVEKSRSKSDAVRNPFEPSAC